MTRISYVLLFALSIQAFGQSAKEYKGKYTREDLGKIPSSPNYEDLKYWVAHPSTKDKADLVPGKGELQDGQSDAEVDVFFIYPTIYSKKQEEAHPWFADVNDQKLNARIANSTIKYQASVFNGSARVYAPLYRQAHIEIYYSELPLKVEALDFAYQDVRKAFEYYLTNWNNDRPIIIASHSQGTDHAVKLLRDYFEEDVAMQNKLVAAYIIGMPLAEYTFNELPACESPASVGCWLTWNTYARDYYPKDHDFWYANALNVNPLSWSLDSSYVSSDHNKGGILKNFKKIRPGLADAQTVDGMLWINKPKFFGNFLLNWKRYHIVDYNLYYMNIRDNVAERVRAYLDQP